MKFLRRYKRFLADVEKRDGAKETVYCPNTGAMTGCDSPGSRAWLSCSENFERKFPKTLEFIETPKGIVGIHSVLANRLVEEAISRTVLGGTRGFKMMRQEPNIPRQQGRFDLQYVVKDQLAFVEVKSVSYLIEPDVGMFPDTASLRALRHLESLIAMVKQGYRAILVFCSQHTGINSVRPAAQIDRKYCNAINLALQSGVEIRALGCSNDLISYEANREIPFILA